jgi:hypothetical protein
MSETTRNTLFSRPKSLASKPCAACNGSGLLQIEGKPVARTVHEVFETMIPCVLCKAGEDMELEFSKELIFGPFAKTRWGTQVRI